MVLHGKPVCNLIGLAFDSGPLDRLIVVATPKCHCLAPKKDDDITLRNVVNNVGADAEGKTKSKLTLNPPATFASLDAESKDASQIISFAKKCDFYASVVGMFPVITGRTDRSGRERRKARDQQAVDIQLPLSNGGIHSPANRRNT